MEKDQDKNIDNIVSLNARPDGHVRKPVMPSNHTNPLYKRLFKFFHAELSKDKGKKPFARFNPDDLF